MNINRHNYETFFLMYVDNELSATEKNVVDIFVKENADLQEELIMLQQSILPKNNIKFDNKEILKRGNNTLTEKLLLLIDNELTATETDQLKKEISSKTSLANEYAILQKTKLNAASHIVFANKAGLYKKEAGKLIVFPWRKVAAAAVLIGFGIWGIVTVFNNKQRVEVAKNNEQKINSIKKVTTPITEEPNNKDNNEFANTSINQIKSNKQLVHTNIPEDITADTHRLNTLHQNYPQNKLQQIAVNEKTLGTATEKNIFNESNKTVPSHVIQTDEINPIAITNKKEKKLQPETVKMFEDILKEIKGNEMAMNTNLIAKIISLTDETDENNDSRILYIKEEKIKNTKLGKLFGKVKKVLHNKENINTSNGLRVGNLEIAFH